MVECDDQTDHDNVVIAFKIQLYFCTICSCLLTFRKISHISSVALLLNYVNSLSPRLNNIIWTWKLVCRFCQYGTHLYRKSKEQNGSRNNEVLHYCFPSLMMATKSAPKTFKISFKFSISTKINQKSLNEK